MKFILVILITMSARGEEPKTIEIKSLVARGATWKYQDDGQDPGGQWHTASFDDSKWNSGPARLGYGDNNEKTLLGFGKDAKKKHAASYFRHSFELPGRVEFGDLELNILADDGAIIYLNGKQAARLRMPKGTVNHPAYSGIQTKNENVFDKIRLPGNLLKPGKNLMAVSVHQQRADSSDLACDLDLTPLTRPRLRPQPEESSEAVNAEKKWPGVAARILETAKTEKGY